MAKVPHRGTRRHGRIESRIAYSATKRELSVLTFQKNLTRTHMSTVVCCQGFEGRHLGQKTISTAVRERAEMLVLLTVPSDCRLRLAMIVCILDVASASVPRPSPIRGYIAFVAAILSSSPELGTTKEVVAKLSSLSIDTAASHAISIRLLSASKACLQSWIILATRF